MCMKLGDDTNKFSKAENDIECWKILEVTKSGYKTPYYSAPVSFREDGTAMLNAVSDDIPYLEYCELVQDSTFLHGESFYIRGNVIHSYNSREEALSVSRNMTNWPLPYTYYINRSVPYTHPFKFSYKVFRCVIPKGTEYVYSDDKKEVCSRRIKIFRN